MVVPSLVIGNDIYVESAGEKWNQPDAKDGVYCIDVISEKIKWFYPTASDVNELSFFDGIIVGGCDNGLVFCISSRTGKVKWTTRLTSVSGKSKFKTYTRSLVNVLTKNIKTGV